VTVEGQAAVLEEAPTPGVVPDPPDGACHRLRVAGVEHVDGGLATDLGKGGGARRNDRQAVAHRLQDGYAEALVEAREEERFGIAVEEVALGVGDPAEQPAARRGVEACGHRLVVDGPRAHQ